MPTPSATVYQLGNGTTLAMTPAGSQTAIAIGQLKTINFSSSKLDLEDITTLTSPGNYREYAPTLLDAGNVAIEGVYNPTDPGQLACFAAFDGRTLCSFVVQFPIFGSETTKGLSIAFTGYFSERPTRTIAADKTVGFAATIKITGAYTETAGS